MANEKGFTIIELMIAMAVMAFGILGFMFMQGRATEGRTAGREMSRATQVAENCSELLLTLDYNDALMTVGTHPSADEDTFDGTVDNQLNSRYGNFVYNTTWSVSNNSAKLKCITVSTSWQIKDNDRGLQNKTINMTLFKYE